MRKTDCRHLPCMFLGHLFHSSQKPTRKLAARTFIQSQYLKALAASLRFAMSGKEALHETITSDLLQLDICRLAAS